jgi:hypothetical protein
MNVVNKIVLIAVIFLTSGLVIAHEGMHAAAQTHIGESHLGLMELSLAVLTLISIGVFALKNSKK